MTNRRIETIDTETGEILRGCLVWIPRKPSCQENFFMAFQDALADLAKDRELTLEPKNVLLLMLSKLDFENYIHISQADTAEEMGMARSAVSRAMKVLVDKQIILVNPGRSRVKCYRLNNNYGWKGKIRNLNEHRQRMRNEGGLSA